MAAFCNEYKLKALNKEPTCFKNYMSPSCINLYLTNYPKSFESTLVAVLKVKHERVPLRLYNSETTKILTQQDFLKNFK